MPKTRHQIADNVALAFLPAKRQAIETSAALFGCVSTLMLARQEAREGPEFASDILRLARDAAIASFDAQDRLHEMHALIAPIRDAWRIPPGAHGPDDTVKPKQTGALQVVEREAA